MEAAESQPAPAAAVAEDANPTPAENNNTDAATTATDAAAADAAPTTADGEGAVKRKKKSRLEKRMERHERTKIAQRAKRKERNERRKERKRAGLDVATTSKPLKPSEQTPSKVTVAIDLAFDDYMLSGDIIKIIKQVQNCYGANRRTRKPVNYWVTSLGGASKARLDSLQGSSSWKFERDSRSFVDVFPNKRIVYLSSESENVLSTLDEDAVYVIGGLVDHNKHKGLTHRMAVERNIEHARLPITEFINMKARRVLTVNHVFEIILKYVELQNWRAAFFAVIPPRKGLEDKAEEEGAEEDSDASGFDYGDEGEEDEGEADEEGEGEKEPSDAASESKRQKADEQDNAEPAVKDSV
eukprot:m.47725 g.47725  ORF g.47725 m.47725 type:complete len:356 (+) comp12657_c0_seq1:102-1169(+)